MHLDVTGIRGDYIDFDPAIRIPNREGAMFTKWTRRTIACIVRRDTRDSRPPRAEEFLAQTSAPLLARSSSTFS